MYIGCIALPFYGKPRSGSLEGETIEKLDLFIGSPIADSTAVTEHYSFRLGTDVYHVNFFTGIDLNKQIVVSVTKNMDGRPYFQLKYDTVDKKAEVNAYNDELFNLFYDSRGYSISKLFIQMIGKLNSTDTETQKNIELVKTFFQTLNDYIPKYLSKHPTEKVLNLFNDMSARSDSVPAYIIKN